MSANKPHTPHTQPHIPSASTTAPTPAQHDAIEMGAAATQPASSSLASARTISDEIAVFLANLRSLFRGPGRRGELQMRAFILTYFAFGSTFLLLRPLSLIKHDMYEETDVSLPKIGWLDVASLLPYALCQILFSGLCEHKEPRVVISSALITTAITMLFFCASTNYYFHVALLAVAGVAHALVFPYCVKVISLCYSAGQRSAIFGVWCSSMFLGGLSGQVLGLASRALFGWRYVYVVPSLLTLACGVAVRQFLLLPSGAVPQSIAPSTSARQHKHKESQQLV